MRKRIIETRRIADLRPHPRQREMFHDLSEIELNRLAEDMEANGLQHPVEVTPDGTVICGHRRIEAANLLGWTEIEVWVRDDLKGDAIEFRFMEDNLNRRQLGPIGMARIYARLKELETGRSAEELFARDKGDLRDQLGKRLDVSGRHLDRCLQVLRTPLPVQRGVELGVVPLTMATKIASLPIRKQESLSEAISDLVGAWHEADERQRREIKDLIRQEVEHEDFVGKPNGRRRKTSDAFAAFERSLRKHMADLDGRTDKIGAAWHESLPTLKQAQTLLSTLITQIEQNGEPDTMSGTRLAP